MKEYFSTGYKNAKKDWRINLIKFVLLLFGIYFMALGIAIYIPTEIGASQVDFTTFVLVGLKTGTTERLDNFTKVYSDMLIYFYLVLTFISTCMGLVNTIRAHKKTMEPKVWIGFVFTLITNIAITFILPKVVYLNSMYVTYDGVKDMIMVNGVVSTGVASWIFAGAFIVFCLGVTCWVKSGWATGPYNTVCDELLKMTRLTFPMARLICDAAMVVPGLILLWVIPNGDKTGFLFTNLSIGTLVFVFATGPLCGAMKKLLDKIIDYDMLKRGNEKVVVVDNEQKAS
ncbi:hypothetical protein SCHIN_v1c00600 [Spiroplasma chinense]|uniref:Uncharacterized protein n=1 Tax=Spiroplasma chinense TaxID=216932 RepID=A0A5B9Y2F7_9MOLU|nr:hypothetical protein [Spiroplasma chinense]QEH61258.1 hypothetical protein SCHIN_v1c00600 [Spiroplasma chinense]